MYADVMHQISNERDLSEFFRFNIKTDQNNNTPINFDSVKFKQVIVPSLVEKVMSVIGTRGLTDDKLEKIKIFLSGDRENPRFQEALTFVQTAEEAVRDRISLGRELIHTMIPTVVRQRMDVSFGLDDHYKVAIPFKAGQHNNAPTPMKDTAFNNPYETMLLTMVYYIRKSN